MTFEESLFIKSFDKKAGVLKTSPSLGKKIVVRDNELKKLMDLLVGKKVTLYLEDTGLDFEVKGFKGEIPLTVRGIKNEKLFDKHDIVTKVENVSPFSGLEFIDIGYIDFSGGDVIGLVLLAISLFIVIFFTYIFMYIVLYPIVLLISSVFTLGEAWKMRRKKKVYVLLDTNNPNALRELKELVSNVINEKGSVEEIPTEILEKPNRNILSKLRKIYKVYNAGVNSQIASLFFASIVIAIWIFKKELIQPALFYIEIILATLYLIGLALTVYSGYSRRKIKSLRNRFEAD